MKRMIYCTVLFFCMAIAHAQTADLLKVRTYREQHANTILQDYMQFLSIPNIAADTSGLHRNTSFIMQWMQQLGISNIQLLYPATAGAPPAVYGEVINSPAAPTLVFYAHYDAQPVNPAQWAKGLSPFTPQLYSGALGSNAQPLPFPADNHFEPDWRIYARSASDDKAGIASILYSYAAIKNNNLPIQYNIKFFFEGEEEAGSPHLSEILQRYSSLLQSSLWIICDGPVHQSGKKQIFLGVRGDAHLDLTVYASKRPLHSGHYGNWAPNPAMMLAKLLASMKDDNGRVTVKGFYNDVQPLTADEKKALSEVPAVDEQLKNELGIKTAEMKNVALSEAINLPSLNINGMQSGNVGKLASNQIPTTATAVIDLRLVMGNDYIRQQQKVIDHIKAQGYFVTDKEPTDDERKKYSKLIKVIAPADGYNAQRTPMHLPIVQKVIAGVQSTTTDHVVLQPTMGGSLPLYVFEKYLHAVTISVPIANYDNNQHAENENIRLQNLWDGIETMAALMLMKQ